MIDLSRIFITISALLMSYPVLATNPDINIIVNEIAWMGNKNSFNDEWIELYNTKETSIDLSGWTLKSFNEKIKIELVGQIQPKSYFLLERTNDDTVLGIKADQIYTGALNNNGNHLILSFNGIVMDEINCSNGWFAGDNKTKQTMEKGSNDWYHSQNPEGTPRTKNDNFNTEKSGVIQNIEIKKDIEMKQKNTPLELKQQILKPFSPLVIASLLSFPLGIAIVFLKRKLKD